MSMKTSNNIIGNRSRDLPVCNAVPQLLRHRVFPSSNETNTKYIQENNSLLKINYLTDFGTIVWFEDDLKFCI
jgi:hypothetical protein